MTPKATAQMGGLTNIKATKGHSSRLRSLQGNRVPLALGTKTPWGKISAVGIINGFLPERYYWMVDFGGCVSMMPACVVESCHDGDYARETK